VQLGIKLKEIKKNGYNWQKNKMNPRTKLEKTKEWEGCKKKQLGIKSKNILRKMCDWPRK
jgi:hypothetical protein